MRRRAYDDVVRMILLISSLLSILDTPECLESRLPRVPSAPDYLGVSVASLAEEIAEYTRVYLEDHLRTTLAISEYLGYRLPTLLTHCMRGVPEVLPATSTGLSMSEHPVESVDCRSHKDILEYLGYLLLEILDFPAAAEYRLPKILNIPGSSAEFSAVGTE